MKVKTLRRYLKDALTRLEYCDDEQEVNLVSNTYFLNHAYVFLGIAGYDGGYVDLDNPVKEDEDDEE